VYAFIEQRPMLLDESVHGGVVLAVADAGADHDRVEVGRVLRAIEQRADLRGMTRPDQFIAHDAADLERVAVDTVIQEQDSGHATVTDRKRRQGF
jgi:hypothetical protein